MRALVIDDPTIAGMVELTLTLEGFDVTVAGSGEEGLLAASQDQPDVIVLDAMMPEVDGWQVGADSYVVQPFDPTHLAREVVRAVRG